ncbi:MAG: hypothetical protein ACKV2Q_24075 [Planctomycetaceae bacterium]
MPVFVDETHFVGVTKAVLMVDCYSAYKAMEQVKLGQILLVAVMFSIIATLSLHGINPRLWLTWHLTTFAGGQVPSNVSP